MSKHECVINTKLQCPHNKISGIICTYCKIPDQKTTLPNYSQTTYFKCPECGPTSVDEDQCCTMCGFDCSIEKINNDIRADTGS